MNSEKAEKKPKIKKVLRVTGDVALFFIILFALFALVLSIASKKDSDGTATVFGYQLRFVRSDSMDKCELTDVSGYRIKSIPVKSCIFVQVAPEDEEQKNQNFPASVAQQESPDFLRHATHISLCTLFVEHF